MKRNDILTIGGVALGVAGAFLLGKNIAAQDAKDAIEEKKDQLLKENPDLDEPQALVEAAADVAEEALEAVRTAEEEAKVPEKTTTATESEKTLEDAEKDALLDPTDETLQKALAEAEAKTAADWADLITAKKVAYETALFELEKALAAAKIAVAAYDKAYEDVVKYQDQLQQARDKLRRLITIRTEVWDAENWALGDAYTVKINELVNLINGAYTIELQKALNKLTPLIFNASVAISKTDNAVDLVEVYAREALNFELLLAMATRLTTVASSTRTKLAELEEHLAS